MRGYKRGGQEHQELVVYKFVAGLCRGRRASKHRVLRVPGVEAPGIELDLPQQLVAELKADWEFELMLSGLDVDLG